MSLLKYIIKRLFSMIPVLFGVLTITFILSRLMPGDPVIALLQTQGISQINPARIASLRRELGLDLPISLQYFRYLSDLFTFNWGRSFSVAPGTPVWELIARRLPRTIDLSIFSMIIASYVGIKIGVISATHRSKARDTIFRGIALIGVSIPVFFLGMLMQYYLGYILDVFPTVGYKQVQYVDPPFITGFYLIDSIIGGYYYLAVDYVWHLTLPVFCLVFVTIAGIVRQTRSSMLEVLQQDYVRTARAKGCKERDVINTHVLKNALIPTITIIGLNFASLLAGAILIESTFGIYGIGLTLINAIQGQDYWVLNALVFVITIIFLITTLITDLLYGIIDPRVRY
ncbi:MAG: ABC transporter permease [Candidatus Heimdallarchaeota archaeon]